ncbi:MAG: Dihydrolipoyllysine-residue succinyltransferase component of 2-oxoglutarate dehydrogenase complex [Gammaproteobacteria bacterium]|nr:Dihydrolipoyllysine-residue succinyltransferase component of 2-oxoglutarate dehydrogenase complex [Gammaproteobacteria bacterium]
MTIEVKVPQLPESISEATVVGWHKAAGDTVNRDENLVDLETEKVVLEVPAPKDGVLTEIKKNDGDTVEADDVLAIVAPDASPKEKPAEDGEQSAEDKKAGKPTRELEQGSPRTSPSVRKLLEEHDLDPSSLKGTGKDGRLLKEDMLKYLEGKEKSATKEKESEKASLRSPLETKSKGERAERREPMSRLRATVASRLKNAQNTAAMLTTFNDVNLQAVMDIRAKYKEAFEEKHGVRLGMMSFFAKAGVEALKRYPIVNAYVEGDEIVYHDYQDIGIAAASPRGLVVPVVRGVGQKSFAEIEAEIAQLGKKARDGKLTMEELSGGTFTITNGGVFGSMLSTPILNPPQSGILGMHRIEKRPVAENGEVAIRPMMYLALTYDHRIIDGAEAVRFLVTVKEMLEDPARLLLQI